MNGGCQSNKISENLLDRTPPIDFCYNGASLRFLWWWWDSWIYTYQPFIIEIALLALSGAIRGSWIKILYQELG